MCLASPTTSVLPRLLSRVTCCPVARELVGVARRYWLVFRCFLHDVLQGNIVVFSKEPDESLLSATHRSTSERLGVAVKHLAATDAASRESLGVYTYSSCGMSPVLACAG